MHCFGVWCALCADTGGVSIVEGKQAVDEDDWERLKVPCTSRTLVFLRTIGLGAVTAPLGRGSIKNAAWVLVNCSMPCRGLTQ